MTVKRIILTAAAAILIFISIFSFNPSKVLAASLGIASQNMSFIQGTATLNITGTEWVPSRIVYIYLEKFSDSGWINQTATDATPDGIGNFTLTVNISQLLPGQYQLRAIQPSGVIVRMAPPIVAISPNFSIVSKPPPPAVPVLISPVGGTNVSTNAIFSWVAIPEAVYNLQISTSANFNATIVNVSGLNTNSANLSKPLSFNTLYFWRVQAVANGEVSAYATATFTTAKSVWPWWYLVLIILVPILITLIITLVYLWTLRVKPGDGTLDGTGKFVEIIPRSGWIISAPGLRGSYQHWQGHGSGVATAEFYQALQAANVDNVLTIEMDVKKVWPVWSWVRTTHKEAGMILNVPDPGKEQGQIVLGIDEECVVTWNFSVNQSSVFKMLSRFWPEWRLHRSKRFVISRRVPNKSIDSLKRSIVGKPGKKILMLFNYPVTDPVLGPIGKDFARKFEEWKYKYPCRARTFNPENYLTENVPALTEQEWRDMGSGPALLFIHGAMMLSHKGFPGFPQNLLRDLWHKYQGRVFAFDRFTGSAGPKENVEDFLSLMPDNVKLDIDIICHSQGGLVARTLAGGYPDLKLQEKLQERHQDIKVGKIIFSGVPNNGTPIGNVKRWADLLNILITTANRAASLPGIPDLVEECMMIAKLIGKVKPSDLVEALPGLAAVDPKGQFLKALNKPGRCANTIFYGLASDFESKGWLKNIANRIYKLIIFGYKKNDIFVPTASVWKANGADGFPIPDKNKHVYKRKDRVSHSDYFAQPRTENMIRFWLL